MQDRETIALLSSQISPSAVRDYAKYRGWEALPNVKGRLWVFRHPEGGLRQLVIPLDKGADYADAMEEIVIRLAASEGRSVEQVFSDLLSVYSDVIRFRIGGDETSSGMLPMTDAPGLLEGARRALLSAACSVVNKVQHHPRMSRVEAEEFLRVCKLGQTEIGSFVVKVSCPLNEMEEPPLAQLTRPFAREATLLLIGACTKIVNGIEQDTVDELLAHDANAPAITSNLCDALLRMHSAREKADLSVSLSWAATPKCPIPDIAASATFKPEYFRAIEEIERHLRPLSEEQEQKTLFGTVETLNGDVGDDGHRSGEVVLALLLQDEEVVRARANLGVNDYATAVEAHEKGRGYVALNGVLKRGVRIGRVENVSDFKLLSPANNQ